MNTKEKILLVQLLLEDIRCDWSDGDSAKARALKAKSLCEEIADATGNADYVCLAEFCDIYTSSSVRWEDWDGRFFRQAFPMGYLEMDKLHGLSHTFKNRSKEFQDVVEEYMTSPELVFKDLEEA